MKSAIFIIFLATAFAGSFATNPLENIWAVLIAGSNGWYNYRHQADVSHSYHLLLKHGVLPEKIIVLMYDDIANNPQNPYMGKIFNFPNGSDVYAGVKIDYRGNNVNSEVFLNVLKGNAAGNAGKGSGRVLKSTRNEHVFVYYSDHGGTDILGMPAGLLTKHDLDLALKHMYDSNMYDKLLFYLEACESGSMFEGIPQVMRIYAITAARANESSFATFCDNKLHLPCLGDEFSVNWIHDTEIHNILSEKVGKQVDDVVSNTKLSHVCQFGDKTIRDDTVADYQGKETLQKPKIDPIEEARFTEQVVEKVGKQVDDVVSNTKLSHVCQFGDKTIRDDTVADYQGKETLQKPKIDPIEEARFTEQVVSQAIDSRQVPLVMAERTLRRLGASPNVISDRMSRYLVKRHTLTDFVRRAAETVAPGSPLLKTVMTKVPKKVTQLQCHDKVIKAFDRLCAPFDRNPFAFKLSAAFANLCEVTRKPEKIVEFFQKECPNGPIFEDVL
uniref:Legumain n=1 Tax=Panagrolaimus sp. JU765 TaxID=591449 RepID=A0AC34Q0F0_9BILA